MLKEKDIRILCRLRQDARENLTTMSRKTSIPVSTIYDRLQKYKGNLIRKNTVLLDFKSLGFDLKVNMLLKVPAECKEKFEGFMKKNERVNSLYRVNNGYDFMAETLFKNMREFKDFTERLEELGMKDMQEFFILEDLKREGFMTDEVFHLAS